MRPANTTPPRVFVSYSQNDAHIAARIRDACVEAGFRCWKAPEDIPVGTDWATAITEAMDGSAAAVFVLSQSSMASPEVLKELSLAVKRRLLVVPMRIEDVSFSGAWEYHIGHLQWIDAFAGTLQSACHDLTTYLQQRLTGQDAPASAPPAKSLDSAKRATPRRRWVLPSFVVVGLAVAAATVYQFATKGTSQSKSTELVQIGGNDPAVGKPTEGTSQSRSTERVQIGRSDPAVGKPAGGTSQSKSTERVQIGGNDPALGRPTEGTSQSKSTEWVQISGNDLAVSKSTEPEDSRKLFQWPGGATVSCGNAYPTSSAYCFLALVDKSPGNNGDYKVNLGIEGWARPDSVDSAGRRLNRSSVVCDVFDAANRHLEDFREDFAPGKINTMIGFRTRTFPVDRVFLIRCTAYLL